MDLSRCVAIAAVLACGCGKDREQASPEPAPSVAAVTAHTVAPAVVAPASASSQAMAATSASAPTHEDEPRVTCGSVSGAEPPGPQGANDPILRARRGTILAKGAKAPTIALRDTDGAPVDVASFLKAGKIVVVELGSVTCPVFRSKVEATNRLQASLGDKAVVLYVYTQEAHPVGSPSPYQEFADKYVPASARHPATEWGAPVNGAGVAQPATYEERVRLAKRTKGELKIAPRVLVDGMDNAVWRAFGGISNGGFVITPDGTVRESEVWFGADTIREAVTKCSVGAGDAGPAQ